MWMSDVQGEKMTEQERKIWKKDFLKTLWMNLAEQYAKLSTCSRKHVGAIIIKHGRVIATGFNGSVEGAEHCSDVGCLLDEGGHCRRTVHAEQAALMFCAKEKISTDDCTMVCVYMPCSTCLKLIQASGIKHIIWKENYEDSASEAIIKDVEKSVLIERYA
jgi:dCMP deaminase